LTNHAQTKSDFNKRYAKSAINTGDMIITTNITDLIIFFKTKLSSMQHGAMFNY